MVHVIFIFLLLWLSAYPPFASHQDEPEHLTRAPRAWTVPAQFPASRRLLRRLYAQL